MTKSMNGKQVVRNQDYFEKLEQMEYKVKSTMKFEDLYNLLKFCTKCRTDKNNGMCNRHKKMTNGWTY